MSEPVVVMEEALSRYRITVEQYHRMGEAGIFPEDARVELLDGEVVAMTPIGSRHAAAVRRLMRTFGSLGDRCLPSPQCPVRLPGDSEPEPDLAILRPREDDYGGRHPGAADVLLLVEVADSSGTKDRFRKGRLYALAGIPEYWIVDLERDLLEIRLRPEGDLWGETRLLHRGDEVAPAAFPDFPVAVDSILPPPVESQES
jgi:Uma2 family endonuclease